VVKNKKLVKFGTIFQKEVPLIFGDTQIPLKHSVRKAEGSLKVKDQLDAFCHSDRTLDCDRQTYT